MRHTEPEHVCDALKGLRAQRETRSWTRRFYDALHVLQALKVVPVMVIFNRHKKNRDCRLLHYTEVVYRHVHSNPGPYVPRSLSVTLSVKERRVYDIFNVLHAIGLVYHDIKLYALTPWLDESATYWWGRLCEDWGEVDRTMLIHHQVIITPANARMRRNVRPKKRTSSGGALVQHAQADLRQLLPQWQTTGLDVEWPVSELCPQDRSRWSEVKLEHVTSAVPEDVLQDSDPTLDSVNVHTGHECVYDEWGVLPTRWFLYNLEPYSGDQTLTSDVILELELFEVTGFGAEM